MPTLEMAVDRLRQVVYFVGAGIKSGVEDEILKAIAAVLVKAQIADGRAAVEGVPDELRAAVLQELAVVAVGGQVTGRARRVGLRGLGAVGADMDQLVIGTDDVSAGILSLLQQQGQRTGQQQIIVVAEGHIHALSNGKPPVAGGADTGVFLGDDLDAVVPLGQIVAKAGGGIGGAVIDQQHLQPGNILGKDGLHGSPQGGCRIVDGHDHTDTRRHNVLHSFQNSFFHFGVKPVIGQGQRGQAL